MIALQYGLQSGDAFYTPNIFCKITLEQKDSSFFEGGAI